MNLSPMISLRQSRATFPFPPTHRVCLHLCGHPLPLGSRASSCLSSRLACSAEKYCPCATYIRVCIVRFRRELRAIPHLENPLHGPRSSRSLRGARWPNLCQNRGQLHGNGARGTAALVAPVLSASTLSTGSYQGSTTSAFKGVGTTSIRMTQTPGAAAVAVASR